MDATDSMQFLLLDDDWRLVGRVKGDLNWQQLVRELLLRGTQWLVVEQRRTGELSPHPRLNDIRLSRAIARRLRPMEVKVADHVIRGDGKQFSFRAAGLL